MQPPFLGPDGSFSQDAWTARNYPQLTAAYLAQPLRVPMYLVSGDNDRLGLAFETALLFKRMFDQQPGITELTDGLDVATLAIGIFGIGEIIANLARPQEERSLVSQKITRLWPTREDFRRAWPAVLRGTGLGAVLGVLPGGGATLSAFAAYALEKKVSKHPDEFGQGAVEGVAGPESANNAGAQTSFIPMLTLGIPGNAVTALLMGALIINGVQPGPMLIVERPDVFWGVVASMYVGNVFLLILNLPMVGLWVQLLRIPYAVMFPIIILLALFWR